MGYEGIEFKDGDLVRYVPHYRLAGTVTGYIIGYDRTSAGIRYAVMDDEGETYNIYDYKGKITLLSPSKKNFPPTPSRTGARVNTVKSKRTIDEIDRENYLKSGSKFDSTSIDEIERDNYIIVIKNIKYHRGMYPVIGGRVAIKTWDGKDLPAKFRNDPDVRWLDELIEFITVEAPDISINNGSAVFGTSFVEYLSPGSPGYGYRVHVDHPEELSMGEIEQYAEEFFEDEKIPHSEKSRLMRKIPRMLLEELEYLNDLYDKAEAEIYKYCEGGASKIRQSFKKWRR